MRSVRSRSRSPARLVDGSTSFQRDGGEAVLTGTLVDQPTLHGVLERVRDLRLSVIAVLHLPPEEEI
jgi:hypothetical protein